MATSGYGATVAGSVIGTIGNIMSVTWSGVDSETIEFKTLADVKRMVNRIAGSRSPGEMTITCVYDATQFKTLVDKSSGDNETWTITLDDGTTIVCDGHIKNVADLGINPDNVKQYTVNIPFSGAPIVTPA